MATRQSSLSPLSTLPSSSSLASISQPSSFIARPAPRPPVSYVLLAEFDIDEGSLLKHSYPVSTGTDEHLLAEHMLPDGAHDRQEDWTVFYLNQIPALTVDKSLLDSPNNPERPEGAPERALNSKMSAEQLLQKKEPKELLYVMSLVRTKKDASVRRGALVKALAVVSHSPYIQIYKPILLLALEDYYRSPSLSILQRLYSAINSMDLTGLPVLSRDERLVLRGSERKDLFEEKFWGGNSISSPLPEHRQLGRTPSTASFATSSNAAEVLDTTASSFDRQSLRSSDSRSSLRDPSASSSTDDLAWKARSRAGTVGSAASDFAAPSGAVSPTEGRSTMAASMIGSTMGSSVGGVTGGRPKDTHFFETKVHYAGIPLPIRIPVGTMEEEIGDYSLINLIQTFSPAPSSSAPASSLVSGPFHPHLHTSGPSTHPVILLMNALLTHKRVVFLGHQQAAGKVAELVLAACALGSGCGAILGGIVQRAFPYTNLSNLDNLQEVPGFIAGVCNPAFLERPSWWDVLLNMETGRIIVSKNIEQPSPSSDARAGGGSGRAWSKTATGGVEGGPASGGRETSGSVSGGGEEGRGAGEGTDAGFMEEILAAIQSHYGEAVIRARVTDYVYRFVRLASRYEEDGGLHPTTIGFPCVGYRSDKLGSGVFFADESIMAREMGAVSGRVEGWRGTKSYRGYQKTFETLSTSSPLGEIDVAHQISRLRQGRRMPDGEVSLILRTLVDLTKTDEQIVAILSHLPSHFGGLLPLAFGLFHPQPTIRASTVELLERLDLHPTGSKFVQSLNAFHRTAYQRLKREQRGVVASPVSARSLPPQVPPKEVF